MTILLAAVALAEELARVIDSSQGAGKDLLSYTRWITQYQRVGVATCFNGITSIQRCDRVLAKKIGRVLYSSEMRLTGVRRPTQLGMHKCASDNGHMEVCSFCQVE